MGGGIDFLEGFGVVVPPPISLERPAAVAVSQVQLGPASLGADAQRAKPGLLRFTNAGVERRVCLRERVIVAEREERLNSKSAGASGLGLNDDGLFSLYEEDFLFQARPTGFESPDREGIEPESDQMAKNSGVTRARVLGRAKGQVRSVDGNCLIQLGQANQS